MLAQAQRMIDPDGNQALSKFADYVFVATVSRPGTRQWWDTFKIGIPDQEYVSRVDKYPRNRIAEWEQIMPWFVQNEE